MTFWHESAMEPKRNYRFLITIGIAATTSDVAAGLNGAQWWAKTCDAPSFDTTEVEHNFFDNKYYYPGRVTWNEINMTVVDPKSINVVHRLNTAIANSGYYVKANTGTEDNPISSISKAKANEGLTGKTNTGFNALTIVVYDAGGLELETWTLQNPFLKSVKFGSLDYSNDELRQLDFTIRYDWCTMAGNTVTIGSDGLPVSTALNGGVPLHKTS